MAFPRSLAFLDVSLMSSIFGMILFIIVNSGVTSTIPQMQLLQIVGVATNYS